MQAPQPSPRVEIGLKILEYFRQQFKLKKASSILLETDLKKRFGYSDAGWASLAEPLNRLPWMQQMGVQISQPQMLGKHTALALADLILSIMQKHADLAARPPRGSFVRAARMPPPSRKPAAKRAKPARRHK